MGRSNQAGGSLNLAPRLWTFSSIISTSNYRQRSTDQSSCISINIPSSTLGRYDAKQIWDCPCANTRQQTRSKMVNSERNRAERAAKRAGRASVAVDEPDESVDTGSIASRAGRRSRLAKSEYSEDVSTHDLNSWYI
jgi:hypothetical protein